MFGFGNAKAPAFDPAEGHPLVREGVAHIAARAWDELLALYEKQGPSDRYHFVQGLGALSQLDDDLPTVFDNPHLMTIVGGIRVGWAWRHRGGGMGEQVNGVNASNMIRCLRTAEGMLEAVGEAAPDDTTAIAWHIRLEMGLNGDDNVLTRLLSRAQRSTETNIFTALNHLTLVSPKWHGSIEQMWSAANGYASRPRNAAWISLAARAHIEEWLYCTGMTKDAAVRDAYLPKLTDPGFRAFIGEMDGMFWKALESAPMSGSEGVVAHNNFAALLVMLNAIDRARPHIERIGPCFTLIPWYYAQYRDNPMVWFNEVRKRASLPALRG